MTTPAALPRVPSALSRERRARDLARLVDGWRPDVLVVGAGVTGAGIAVDAATRGLSAALIDRGDLANGTSRWSSKLVHGGLRYLARGDIGLARESAVERGLLMTRIAPHLTRALPFVTPVCRGGSPGVAAVAGLGFVLGDLLRLSAGTDARTLPRARWLGSRQVLQRVPVVARNGLRGGWLNFDGQLVDDARLVVALARTAAAFGTAVLPRVAATAVGRDTADIVDGWSGQRARVTAGRVVVAAGPWADTLDDRVRLRPSKGAHVVLDPVSLGLPRTALSVPVAGQISRFVFALPQPDGRVYAGLTDDPVDGVVPDVAEVTAGETGFLLAALSTVLERPLTVADVQGGFAGFRPLVAGEAATTAELSRDHLIVDDGEGPVTIVGGKLTTYRRMAEDVVDRLTPRPCRSAHLPLVGALPRRRLQALPQSDWLVGRYGAEAVDVAALARADPLLADRVLPHLPYLAAEFAFALLREGAADVADLLDRRTRIGVVPADRAAAVPVAQAVLARYGG